MSCSFVGASGEVVGGIANSGKAYVVFGNRQWK